jgi:DNA-binding IclR family transcriptional regulator
VSAAQNRGDAEETVDDHTVIGRALEIIDAVRDLGPGITLADLTSAVGIPKASTRRIAEDLANRGVLVRDRAGYSLGRRLGSWSSHGHYPARGGAVSVLAELSRTAEGVAWLAIQHDGLTVSLIHIHPVSQWPTWNLSALVNTAAGRLVLAERPDIVDRLDHTTLPRTTATSPTSAKKLRPLLKQVHDLGASLEANSFLAGWRCGAIRAEPAGGRRLIIGLSAPADRASPQAMLSSLQRAAAEIDTSVITSS